MQTGSFVGTQRRWLESAVSIGRRDGSAIYKGSASFPETASSVLIIIVSLLS